MLRNFNFACGVILLLSFFIFVNSQSLFMFILLWGISLFFVNTYSKSKLYIETEITVVTIISLIFCNVVVLKYIDYYLGIEFFNNVLVQNMFTLILILGLQFIEVWFAKFISRVLNKREYKRETDSDYDEDIV